MKISGTTKMNLKYVATIFLIQCFVTATFCKHLQKTQDFTECQSSSKKTIMSLQVMTFEGETFDKSTLLEKLSSFFGIEKNNIKLGLISRSVEELTFPIKILIACDNKILSEIKWNNKLLREVLEDGSFKTATRLKTDIWSIYKEMPKKYRESIKKFKRDVKEDDIYEGDEDYEDAEYEDDEDLSDTDLSNNNIANSSSLTTSTSTTTTSTSPPIITHTHRHHHGNGNKETLQNLAKGDEGILQTSTEQSTEATSTSTTTITSTSTTISTTSPSTTTTEAVEERNSKPEIGNRVPMQRVTAGKFFKITIPENTFYDKEDKTKLKLSLLDRNKEPIIKSAWLQFDDVNRIIYGLPLEETVSRWQFNLVATDTEGESITESIDIAVQQHKGHRIANNEITIDAILIEQYRFSVDWQLELARAISETVDEPTVSISSIVVRDITYDKENSSRVYFKFTNETLTKEECPQAKLDQLIAFIFTNLPTKLNESKIQIQAIDGQLIGSCKSTIVTPKTQLTPISIKNYPPVPRNQVDRVNATVGHLMVFKVPQDTFYDPEDATNLRLFLQTQDKKNISEKNWLQFDSKNQEFYGIPKNSDHGTEDYILVAEDKEGEQATDALVVVIDSPPRRDYPVYIKILLGIKNDDFKAGAQRKFVERIASIFGDSTTNYIQIRSINPTPEFDGTLVTFYNTTLHKVQHQCPEDRISYVRNVFLHHDNIIKDHVRKAFEDDFKLRTLSISGACHPNQNIFNTGKMPSVTNRYPISNNPSSTSTTSSTLGDDYLYSFIIPAIIIIFMLLLASIVACILHRRKLTGKMEIGDEEEKKSFRSKGIPVIFQDELEEKPDIGNKSPIILKYEKPPLLPHNKDGDNDVQKYLPPLSGYIGGREQRGKSPVTPSYRKPPPYVSP